VLFRSKRNSEFWSGLHHCFTLMDYCSQGIQKASIMRGMYSAYAARPFMNWQKTRCAQGMRKSNSGRDACMETGKQ
jgi:hypothetical protein